MARRWTEPAAGYRMDAVFGGSINRGGGEYVPASYVGRQISEEELAK